MSHYVRILARQTDLPSLATLEARMHEKGLSVMLKMDKGSPTEWLQLTASHTSGTPITCVERDIVAASRTAKREITELIKDAQNGLPKTSRAWVVNFLSSVKAIYAFQVLRGKEEQNGWAIFDCLLAAIFDSSQGIIHADREGFSNEFGDDALWLCSKPFGEVRRVAVLGGYCWLRFDLNLQNHKHCAAFRRGEVPDGVQTIV